MLDVVDSMTSPDADESDVVPSQLKQDREELAFVHGF
jgi:hypothetical protein